jgi:hypothetical protein
VVGNLMVVIVDHVTPKDGDDSTEVVKTAESIEADIEELLRCGLRMVVCYGV